MGIPDVDEMEAMVKKTAIQCFILVVALIVGAFILGAYLG